MDNNMEAVNALIQELTGTVASNEVLKSKLKKYEKYKTKYDSIKKEYLSIFEEYEKFSKNIESILTEQEALKYILFAILIQTGGTLEISKDTFDIANNRYKTEEITYNSANGAVTYNIKRRDNDTQVQSSAS